MITRLPAVAAELERWREESLTLPIWWRDDDAIIPTPALDRLLALAERFKAPLNLAVIPEPATRQLADRLRTMPDVFVLVHGWKHVNHAPPDQKKAEFGPQRAVTVMLEEIADGRRRLLDLFSDRMLPIFTPPWNRIAPEAIEGLRGSGFRALSTFTPRQAKYAATDLLQVNTHLDPIAWKAGGGLLDAALLDLQVAQQLEARRIGAADNAEPYGFLTHHLVQDEPTWSSTATILETFLGSGVARWTSPLHELC